MQCVCFSANGANGAMLDTRLSVAKSTGRLDLSDCGLTEVPQAVFEIRDLVDLSLAGNQITVLPDKIANLTQLKRLALAGNKLQFLPESIGSLSHLEGLWAHGNLLQNLPNQVGSLKRMRMLALAGNQLKSIPSSICSLASLESLSIAGNELSELPPEIGGLTSLRTLALHGNYLNRVPSSLCELPSLRQLWLQGNDLESLPEDFSKLSALREVSVADNLLTSIPRSVGSLRSLESLCIYGNRISHLPEAWHAARSLRYLWMEGNPLEPTSLSSVIPQLRFLRAVGIDSNQARGVSSCGLIRSSGEQALRIGHMAGTGEASLNGGYFKVTRHSEAGVTDGDLAQLLVVAFGSAPGVPNWGGLLKRVKNCLESKGFPAAFDTLYVVDPRRSWYSHSKRGTASLLCDDDDDHASAALPSPDGLFFNPSSSCSLVNQESQSKKGGAISTRGATAKQFGPESYYFKELSASVKGYRRVIMLGDSMGASAALMFSQLATAVMAFCPQVDLTSASIRPSRSDAWFQSFRDNLLSAASSSSASITVHCGDWSHDLNQAQMLPKPQVQVVTHPINDHRLAKALNEQGRLVPLVAELIEKEISEAYAFL